MCIYIYIERERERHIYMYAYIKQHAGTACDRFAQLFDAAEAQGRGR